MRSQAGFTLIEVIIAAVILFSAVAVTSELYKSSLLSAEKAGASAQIYQINPTAVSMIQSSIIELHQLGSKPRYSQQFDLMGVNYSWQAERLFFKPRAPFTVDEVPTDDRYSLYSVTVKVRKGTKVVDFKFEVAAW